MRCGKIAVATAAAVVAVDSVKCSGHRHRQTKGQSRRSGCTRLGLSTTGRSNLLQPHMWLSQLRPHWIASTSTSMTFGPVEIGKGDTVPK